jgi:hypothetical protein
VSGIAQDNADIERKLRELNIMENIFEAALEEGNGLDRGRGSIGQSDSMYLAGQGMVFTFHVNSFRRFGIQGGNFGAEWTQYMNETMARTRESLERVRLSFPDTDFDFDFDFDFDDEPIVFTRGQGFPQAPQVVFLGNEGPEREAARDMEEAMRDTQEQVREMQRQVRNLERQVQGQQGENVAGIESEIAAIEARMEGQMAQMDEQRQAYETFMSELQEARQNQQVAMADEASTQIIQTLCDYGATLRSLESDEHVTIILEDVIDDTDQLYVFNFSDIRDCSSAETLKQSAVSYRMSGN